MDSAKQETFRNYRVPDSGRIQKVKGWLLRNGYLKPGMKILELGYSHGGLLDRLKEIDASKYAMDVNQRETDSNITFIPQDCNYILPFASGEFDVVFAGELIEHIYDDEKFLMEVSRILKPGGIAVITAPNLFYSLNRILFPFGKFPMFAYAPYHYHLYDIKTLIGLARKCGFMIKHVTSSHILFSSRNYEFLGSIFEKLGGVFPTIGAHIILFAQKEVKS